jgi:hypothetical protein
MRATIVSGLLASLLTLASAQVREVWRYVYTPPQDDLAAHLERAVRLSDGGLMLLGWVETPLNGRDALAIRLLPSGAEAWVYQVDGAGFDDAFVDAIESADELRLLGQFTDADGYLVRAGASPHARRSAERGIHPQPHPEHASAPTAVQRL